jgi:hypothetical protein
VQSGVSSIASPNVNVYAMILIVILVL